MAHEITPWIQFQMNISIHRQGGFEIIRPASLRGRGIACSTYADLYAGARGLDAQFVAFAVAVFRVVSQSVTRPNLFRQSLEDRREIAGVGGEVLPARRLHDARG